MDNTKFVAAIQMDVAIGDLQKNLKAIVASMNRVSQQNIFLCCFPECAISGYCFDSLEEAMDAALDTGDQLFQELVSAVQDFQVNVVCGFLERGDGKVFNSAALVTRSGGVHVYRKTHLPFLGVDRFSTPGDDRSLQVFDVDGVRIGMNICYDCSFPEPSRVLSLAGADLIALPTNWPPGAGLTADYVPNARALENNVYFMAVNRVGSEGGFDFIGKSKICHPDGHDLAFADHAREEILIAEIDPVVARQKRIVRVPGKHVIDRFKDRRPEMYKQITAEKRRMR